MRHRPAPVAARKSYKRPEWDSSSAKHSELFVSPSQSALANEERLKTLVASLRDGGERQRVMEFATAGAVSVRPQRNTADEIARLTLLTSSCQQKLIQSRSKLAECHAENRRLEAALQAAQAESASLRAEAGALRSEARFGMHLDDLQATRPVSLPGAVDEAVRRVQPSADLLRSSFSSAPLTGSSSPSTFAELLQHWSLEGLLSSAGGAPLARHVAHAILRPLRAALDASDAGAGAASALERSFCAELCALGGRPALLALLRESPLLETLATDLYEQLQPLAAAVHSADPTTPAAAAAAAAAPTPPPPPPMLPFPLKCISSPPALETTVHVRMRLGGRASDLMPSKLVRSLARRAGLTDESAIQLKAPVAEPAGRSFAVEAIIIAADEPAMRACEALAVVTPPLPGTAEAAEMAEAAHRIGMTPEQAHEMAWHQARQATEALGNDLGVKILEPPEFTLARGVPTASMGGVDTFHSGLSGLIGPAHPSVAASCDEPSSDAAAMELLRAEHCSRADAQLPFGSDACYGIHTSSELEFWVVVDPEGMRAPLATRPHYLHLMRGAEWPRERKGAALASPRVPTPLSFFDGVRAAIGAQLQNALSPRELESRPGAATLSDTLFVALRLWTGPMREKYNAVLRAAPATPHAAPVHLYETYVRLCAPDEPGGVVAGGGAGGGGGAGRGGAGAGLGDSTTIPYAQTIHAINLAVCMLSRLTRAGVVYRAPPCATAAVPPPSLPAPPLPADHLAASHNDLAAAAAEANLNTNTAAAAQANTNTAAPPWPRELIELDSVSGTRGGIELGITSACSDRARALAYAEGRAAAPRQAAGGGAAGQGVLFEIAMGLVDRGCEVGWCSQFPEEHEVVFGPCTAFELIPSPEALLSDGAERAAAAGAAVGGGDPCGVARRVEAGVVIIPLRASTRLPRRGYALNETAAATAAAAAAAAAAALEGRRPARRPAGQPQHRPPQQRASPAQPASATSPPPPRLARPKSVPAGALGGMQPVHAAQRQVLRTPPAAAAPPGRRAPSLPSPPTHPPPPPPPPPPPAAHGVSLSAMSLQAAKEMGLQLLGEADGARNGSRSSLGAVCDGGGQSAEGGGGSGSGCGGSGGSGCGGGGDGGRSLCGSAVAAVREVRPRASPPDVTHDGTQMVPRPQHFEHLFSDEVPSTQLPKLDLATQTILAEQEALRQQMGEGSQM